MFYIEQINNMTNYTMEELIKAEHVKFHMFCLRDSKKIQI